MTKSKINGLISAPVTPFNKDGSINCAEVKAYADKLKQDGVTGVFVNGTTGEGFSLTLAERKALAEAWLKEQTADFPVIIHVSHTSIESSKEMARHAEQHGAQAIGDMGPIFFKPGNIKDLVNNSIAIADAAPNTPYYYYHMPSMSGINFPMIAYLEEAHGRISNLAGIKYTFEDLMDAELCRAYEDGRYQVFHGRDETLICSLAFGCADGVGSTYNYMAPDYLKLVDAFNNGDMKQSRALQKKSINIIKAICDTGNFFSGLRFILEQQGLKVGEVRLPHQPLTEDQKLSLLEKVKNLGLL